MSSKFLSSLSSFSVLTNGEASLYIKDLKVENLNGNQNVSTNSEGSLISTENVIDTLKNGNENLDLGSTKTNYIDLKHYTPGNPLSNAVRLYSKSDNNIYYKDSLGNEISIGQSNAFDQNLNKNDSVQFSGLNMSSNTITNIGAGINPTDAVNLSQLNSISSNIIKPHYFTFKTVFSAAPGTFNFNGPTPSTASQIRMTLLDEIGENLLYIIERANNTLILIMRSSSTVKIFRLTSFFGSAGYRTINYQFITESNTVAFSDNERCSFEFQYNPFNQNLGVENGPVFNQLTTPTITGYMLTFSGDDRQNDVGGYLSPGNDKDFRLSALTLDSRQVVPHAGVLDRITYIRSNIGQTSPPGMSYVSIRVEKIDGTTPFLITCVIPEGRLFGVIEISGNQNLDDGDAIAIYIDRTGQPNSYFMGRSTINVYIAPTNNKKAPNNEIAASQLISSYTINTDLSVYDRLDTIDSLIRYNSTTNETEIQAPISVIDF